MTDTTATGPHSHVVLGEGLDSNKQRTWWVIALCGAMMVAEVASGFAFGSIALVADGLHMSTHAGALLLAARCSLRRSPTAWRAATRPTSGSPSAPASSATSPGSAARPCWG